MNTIASLRRKFGITLACASAFFGLIVCSHGQGTLTFTFEGLPPGMVSQGNYTAFGRAFYAIPFLALYRSGGSVVGYPDNGTGYLYKPDGPLFGMRFESTNTSPTSAPFNLDSFDAAEYFGDTTPLTVIGYKPMAGTVTNIFTFDGINDGTGPLQDFQTFYLDSSFVNLFRVDILSGRWAIDNWTISGVPEPSSDALLVMGIFSAFGWSRMGRKRSSQR